MHSFASLDSKTCKHPFYKTRYVIQTDFVQNASLSVMTQTQIWSMHSFASTDSLWGEEGDAVGPLEEDAPQPPETWLMLEFCDRGSLLVRLTWGTCSSTSSYIQLAFIY